MNAYGMGNGMMNGGTGNGMYGAPQQQQWNPWQQQQTNYMQQMMQMMQPRGGLLPRQQYSEGNVNYPSPGGVEAISRPAVANYASPMGEESINPFVKPAVPAWSPESGGGA